MHFNQTQRARNEQRRVRHESECIHNSQKQMPTEKKIRYDRHKRDDARANYPQEHRPKTVGDDECAERDMQTYK